MVEILKHCHSLECGGHFNGQRTTEKYYSQASTGLLYSRMPTSMLSHVIGVKEHVILRKETKGL